MKRSLLAALVLLSASGGISGQSSTTAARPNDPPDREYRLESSMLGYRGIGGEIDGIRNPTLWAKTGETVRITIVNGELMVHDIALENGDVRSTQILDKGATANITFKATAPDTYFCSLPGHRVAGMEGRLEVSDSRPSSDGTTPEAGGRVLNLDFESGTLDNWTATGDAFDLVKGDGLPDGGADRSSAVRGQSGTYWISSGVKGSARK